MESKRLIPYSVHLPEEIYKKLKAAAGERKASALVRDAITIIIEGDDEFNGGYNKAVRDVISTLNDDQWCTVIGVGGQSLANYLEGQLRPMLVPQNVKGKSNGKNKKA
jgi:aryl-phospho-beta-D-glucosidase BglC (GH1 family)